MRADAWIDAVKAHGVLGVAHAFGLEHFERPAPGSLSPCPACGAERRHTKSGDKRGAVGLTRDGGGWRCFQCDASGDAVGLAARLATGGKVPAKGDSTWRDVRRACADRGLCEAASDGPPAKRAPLPRPAPPPPPPPPERLPADELAAFWAACAPLSAALASDHALDRQAVAFLRGKGHHVEQLAALDLARLTPLPGTYAFPAWWPAGRAATWRLVLPAYTSTGQLAAFHGRATGPLPPPTPDGKRPPKALWPKSLDRYSLAGLLFADKLGLDVLRAAAGIELLEGVLVCEGLTDTLAAAAWVVRAELLYAVLGVESGSEAAFAEVSWPAGVPVIVATDNDQAGDGYAAKIEKALPAHVELRRAVIPQEVTP